MKLQELNILTEAAGEAALSEIAMNGAPQAMMYRGTRNQGNIVRLPVRKDRRPLDSSNLETALFNLEIEKRFGIRNVRAQVAFATSNYVEAVNYNSSVYCIIPPKNSKVLYNPTVADSVYVCGEIAIAVYKLPFTDGDYAAIRGMSSMDPEGIIEKLLEHASDDAKEGFQRIREYHVPQLLAGYQLVSATEVPPSERRSTEYMILADEVYGIHAQYIRESTAAEGTIHTRMLTMLDQNRGGASQ